MIDKKKPAKREIPAKGAALKKKAAQWEKVDAGQGIWRMKKGDLNVGPFYCDKDAQMAMDKADGILRY
jgi:hypothetical protein